MEIVLFVEIPLSATLPSILLLWRWLELSFLRTAKEVTCIREKKGKVMKVLATTKGMN